MTPELEALARRAVACPRWRWMPGMATNSKFRRVVDACPVERVPCCAEEGSTEDDCHAVWLEHADLLPDLTDPATLGCLLALVRKAWNDPRLVVVPMSGGRWGVAISTVMREGPRHCDSTEAAALVSALEAAP